MGGGLARSGAVIFKWSLHDKGRTASGLRY
jgi:hypothetical protein